MTDDAPAYHRGEADADGFVAWSFAPPRFNASFGRLRVRAEPDGTARIRVETGTRAGNIHDRLHGGFALAAIDQSLPLGIVALRDTTFGGVVTLSLATSFVAAGAVDRPIDILVSIIGESGRLYFLSGTVVQDEAVLLAWQATLRKVRP